MTANYPTRITREQLDQCSHRDMLVVLFTDDAVELYDAKESMIGAENLREIERRVMLSMIDQHWREHLYEMDYLREGINLRAMGQKDPLAEWQREGFDMFEAMMGQIQDQFVAYVSHLQVAAVEEAPRGPRHRADALQRRRRPGPGVGRAAGAAASMPAEELTGEFGAGPEGCDRRHSGRGSVDDAVRVDKTPGRNEPCFCGVARSTSSATVADRVASSLHAEVRQCVISPTTSPSCAAASRAPAPT